MPSNAPPSPFPFLPVVLESPAGAQGRARPAAERTGRSSDKATPEISRGKGRATCRGVAGVVQSVPGLSLDDGAEALRVEIVRRLDPAGVTLLGAIVR
ncbi:hypothetical protein [Pandoraea fibrosis]|uniref:Uncharacterized protein n=1 Tax=Pandoraea fibrosis TaxID=1891094 RepID=A0A5E4UGX8_9BURK|nr:hypothetical protein [Pandoraea fibrosis]QHE93833.1 hypothetical protein PJ20_019910 [Pandoraea fibrosis]QHF12605.1 hypothetical protein PI93_008085 [Pandoraea fibrosis]VVD98154.1 hypothetical protein PFI31113_01936 [Pandoraea fibrosis]